MSESTCLIPMADGDSISILAPLRAALRSSPALEPLPAHTAGASPGCTVHWTTLTTTMGTRWCCRKRRDGADRGHRRDERDGTHQVRAAVDAAWNRFRREESRATERRAARSTRRDDFWSEFPRRISLSSLVSSYIERAHPVLFAAGCTSSACSMKRDDVGARRSARLPTQHRASLGSPRSVVTDTGSLVRAVYAWMARFDHGKLRCGADQRAHALDSSPNGSCRRRRSHSAITRRRQTVYPDLQDDVGPRPAVEWLRWMRASLRCRFPRRRPRG